MLDKQGQRRGAESTRFVSQLSGRRATVCSSALKTHLSSVLLDSFILQSIRLNLGISLLITCTFEVVNGVPAMRKSSSATSPCSDKFVPHDTGRGPRDRRFRLLSPRALVGLRAPVRKPVSERPLKFGVKDSTLSAKRKFPSSVAVLIAARFKAGLPAATCFSSSRRSGSSKGWS